MSHFRSLKTRDFRLSSQIRILDSEELTIYLSSLENVKQVIYEDVIFRDIITGVRDVIVECVSDAIVAG